MTNTALFLYENGLDVRLVRFRLYETASQELVLTASQLLPVPQADEFMVRPRSGVQTQVAARVARERRASIPERLVAHAALAEGESLRIVVPAGVAEDREAISAWLEEDATRAQVTWHQDAQAPARWAVDGETHNLTTLIKKIILDATGEPSKTQAWGPNWFRNTTGVPLWKIAEPLE